MKVKRTTAYFVASLGTLALFWLLGNIWEKCDKEI